MSKYLVSFGDSDKYSVEFPGTLEQFKSSPKLKELTDKAMAYVKEKFPMASNLTDLIPLHVEEADGKTGFPELDMANISGLLKNVLTQVGVDKFTDKLNLNAPFDKL